MTLSLFSHLSSCTPPRPTGGDELHSEVHVTPLSHHTVGFFHGYYLLHYGIGVVQV